MTGARSAADPAAVAAIDLYGLGCLAIELALGQPPFLGETPKALVFAHVHQRPPALAELRTDLPVELADLAGELLGQDPAARPPDAAAVVAQLEIIRERAAAARSAACGCWWSTTTASACASSGARCARPRPLAGRRRARWPRGGGRG
ncbi:MAG: hypothetical protein HS111_32890 [Kofleriaceae bacterium]|nr:hypothetical protein [Kofleriaceae bacterium]